jgi:beta-glucosidase/6-phospho-beta-glucosidase/beta-galactosidase
MGRRRLARTAILVALVSPGCSDPSPSSPEDTGSSAAEDTITSGAATTTAAVDTTTTSADTTGEPPLQFEFPPEFAWGFAVAGFQAEAGCPTIPADPCEDPASDWYQWVTDPELIAETSAYLSGDPLSAAPGMYELYDADFARARDELQLSVARLSIEWSRVFPDGAAEAATTVDELAAMADPDAVAYYHALFASAKAHDLDLLVTLNHYTLPLWIHDGKSCHFDLDTCTRRGWLDRDRILPAISLYAAWCAREFGDEVDVWATLNEPLAVVVAGYLLASPSRTNPPGLQFAPDEAVTVLFNMAEGHAQMYEAVHANDEGDADGDGVMALVGPVMNLSPAVPADPDNPLDVRGAEHADYLYNRVFFEVFTSGTFDRNLDGEVDETNPDYADRLDFVGVNYYTRVVVTGTEEPVFLDYPFFDFLPDTDDLFAPYPEGLGEVVRAAAAYGKPIYVTENGTDRIATQTAEDFLLPHLRSLHAAITDGVDVRGYMYWTLVDNYEWNHGMQLRLGLYELGPDKSRTLRPVGAAYGELAGAGGF